MRVFPAGHDHKDWRCEDARVAGGTRTELLSGVAPGTQGQFDSLSINSQGLVTLTSDKADRPRIVDGSCTYALPPKLYVMVRCGLASQERVFTAALVPKGSGLACTLGASFTMGFDLIGEEQILFTEVLS